MKFILVCGSLPAVLAGGIEESDQVVSHIWITYALGWWGAGDGTLSRRHELSSIGRSEIQSALLDTSDDHELKTNIDYIQAVLAAGEIIEDCA